MKMLLSVPILAAFFAFSCPPPPPPIGGPPLDGFQVQTYYQEFLNEAPTTPARLLPYTFVETHYLFSTQPTHGTETTCNDTTNFQSLFQCPNTKLPAVWEFTFGSGPCWGISDATNVDIQPASKVGYVCEIHHHRFGLSTVSIDVSAPPPTIQFTGFGMDATYGMPVIKFLNLETGDESTNTTASAINGDGTWLEASTPYLGFTYSGQYVAIVYNVKSDGSLEGVGGDWLEIYGNDPPPPPPSDSCLDPGSPNQCEVQ